MSYDNQLYAITKDDYKLITSKNLAVNMQKQESIKFNYSSFFKTLQIKQIVLSGLSHMFSVTLDGVVFGMGNNDFGQLGLPKQSKSKLNNTNNLEQNFMSQHTQFSGLIFSSQGSQRNTADQTLIDKNSNSSHYQNWTPMMYFVERGILIREVKTGDDFSIFISQDIQPRIFACGQNNQSQILGIFDEQVVTEPKEIDLSDFKANCIAEDYVKSVQCGSTFTCILMGKISLYQSINIISVSGRVYIQGTINGILIEYPQQIQAPNIEIFNIFCYRNLLLILDRYGQIFQYNPLNNNIQLLSFLKPVQAKDIHFQSQFQLFVRNIKNVMFRVNLQTQTIQIVNEKIELFASNDNFMSFCYQQKTLQTQNTTDKQKQQYKKNENNLSSINNSSMIAKSNKMNNQSNFCISKSSMMKSIKANVKKRLNCKIQTPQVKDQGGGMITINPMNSDMNILVNEDINIPPTINNQQSDFLDKIKAQQQVQVLQQMLDSMQKENIELKAQVKSHKENREKDQQLIKMLCENLDQYQAGLSCNQCKLYEIEIKTLRQNMDLQNERIDQLQRDSVLVFQQSIANRSTIEPCTTQYLRRSPISRTTPLTADPSAFFHDITNFNNNQGTQNSNRSNRNGLVNPFEIMRKSDCYGEIDQVERRKYFTSSQNTKRSPSGFKRAATQIANAKNSERKKHGCIFSNIQNSIEKEDNQSVLESRIRFASIHDSVSDTFDDFLNKSAQKLKKIIKECSTSKKCSQRKKEDYSPMKENVYSTSPFNISIYSKDTTVNNGRPLNLLQQQQQQSQNSSLILMMKNGKQQKNQHQQQQTSLKKYQEKISKLQENKARLQERLNTLSNQATFKTISANNTINI